MRFNWRNFLYDPNELAGGAAPPAPVVEPPAASPWAADAATYFGEDPAAIAGFDRYMREKQQPYITQLEEGSAQARELWTDLNADPDTTARDLIASIYANQPEVVAAYNAIFDAAPEPVVEPPAVIPPAEDVPEWAKRAEAREQAIADKEFAEAQAAEYVTFKEGLKTSHALTDADIAAIDVFIYQSPNDTDAAVAAYKAWRVAQGFVEPPAAVVPTPPPVLGTDGTSAVPPLATPYTKYNEIGGAIQNFLATQRASSTPPPVLG